LRSIVAMEVAAKIAQRVAVAVGARLGASAGVFGTSISSGWATLGISILAAIVVDMSVDWFAKLAGYDPVGQVAEKVEETLGQVQSLLIDGDPEAMQYYMKLRTLEKGWPPWSSQSP
jgi:hypothetical protein